MVVSLFLLMLRISELRQLLVVVGMVEMIVTQAELVVAVVEQHLYFPIIPQEQLVGLLEDKDKMGLVV